MHLFPRQYPHPQHVQQDVAKCEAFASVEVFCPSRPSDVHEMKIPLSFKGRVCPPHLCSYSPRCQQVFLETRVAHLPPRAFALYLLIETCAKSCGLALRTPFCLASTSLQILQNSAAPRVIPGIMGRYMEAGGVTWLMLLPDPFDGFLNILDSFNQLC